MITDSKIFIFALFFRISTAIFMRTWFVPDEIFQSTEVAYKVSYGQGDLAWEWHEDNALRSAIHPCCLAIFYWVLKKFGLDSNFGIVYGPKIVHAIIFAFGDVFFVKLARRVLNGHEKSFYYTIFVYFSNWFTIYCAPRTLSNSLETALTLIAMNWYPLDGIYAQNKPIWPYLLISSTTLLIRPTAVLIWGPLVLLHTWRVLERWKSFGFGWLFKNMVLPCLISLIFGLMIDSYFYGKFTLSFWNFAVFNVFTGGSAHFGSHPWHWYLTQGWPSLLTVSAYPTIMGVWKKFPNVKPLTKIFFNIAIFYMVVHSFLAHKEHRFFLPLLPFFSLYAGHYIGRSQKHEKFWICSILLTNFLLVVYFCLFHQRGPISAHIEIFEDLSKNMDQKVEIFQLMPCYSMPLHANFHPYTVNIQMLDCSPNLAKIPNFQDESDLFHENPYKWVESNLDRLSTPEYIVVYEKTFNKISSLLQNQNQGFSIWKKIYHTIILMSDNQDNYLYILKRKIL